MAIVIEYLEFTEDDCEVTELEYCAASLLTSPGKDITAVLFVRMSLEIIRARMVKEANPDDDVDEGRIDADELIKKALGALNAGVPAVHPKVV